MRHFRPEASPEYCFSEFFPERCDFFILKRSLETQVSYLVQ